MTEVMNTIYGYTKRAARCLAMTLLMLLTLGTTVSWGQTDYSGTYYIASTSTKVNGKNDQYTYNISNPANNYYLCSTEGWIYYKPNNNWDTDGTTYPNPFLTTYKCRDGVYDASKAVWIVEKHPTEENCYYIIQKKTGKYLISNGTISGANARRMRVHLEAVPDLSSLDDKALFEITAHNSHLDIVPHSSEGRNGTGNEKYLVVNTGNSNQLDGNSSKDGGPNNTYKNTGGIIGVYDASNDEHNFYLEDVIARPSIAYNASSLIEITDQTGSATAIYYTTDGSTPTTSSTLYAEPFDFADDMTTIKAIAIVGGEASNVAVFTPIVHAGSSHVRLIQSQNNAWGEDFHFYMIPGDEESNVTKVNTTSLFRPSMEWYFLSAGVESNVQYYYIVNNATGKYICYDASTVYMDEFGSGGDKFKFKIVESATAGTYNIVPYALRTASGNTNRFLCKPNDGGNVSNTNAKPIALNNASNAQSNWKFILPGALDKTAPFTVPNSTGTSYYRIASVGSSGYYIVTPSGNATNVTTSNSVSDTMNWYFEEAQTATSSDWCTYYHIRNALTGEYLYFTKDANNVGACLEMRSTIVAENADRYMFTWARTASNGQYYIIPKLLKDTEKNRISTFWRDNGNLKTILNRGAGNYAWTFESVDFCNDPVITQAVDRSITITCPTAGATIYYTTDGTEPVVPVGGSTTQEYTAASFTPENGVEQIKAIAVNGDGTSSVVTFTLPKFTYKIVNRSNAIAATSETLQQAPGKSLSGYSDIPESIRSSYIADETVQFYTMDGDFDASLLDAEHRIKQTPASSATIYVTYTTEHLGEQFLPLTKAAPYNVRNSSREYLYGNGTLATNASPSDDDTKTNPYLWYFLGSDPYDVTVQNVGEKSYLNYVSSALSLNTAQTFFLKTTSYVNTTTKDVTLRNASGEDVTLRVNTVELPLSFTLIDKANKLIESGITYPGTFALPAAWQSPVVSQYKYYKKYTSLVNDVYTFAEEDRIYSIEDREGNVIYVTYDVSDALDLDGRNFLGADGKTGKTYMMQYANGDEFYQEDGSDGLMAEKRKAIYPYNNGDATLYVYGSARWETQLASGASTRTRWLWYLEPALKVGEDYVLDPYHVRISSYQNQTNYADPDTKEILTQFHSYLRTYKPTDYSGVVTGTTNNNPLTIGRDASATALTGDELPAGTEYMLIGTTLNNLKLVTTDAINDGSTTERRTVTSFEQYWKNSPTVQNKLTTKVETWGRDVTLSDTQESEVEGMTMNDENLGWHAYTAVANAAPWVNNDDATPSSAPTTSKKFRKEEHVFQTIGMGDGSFQFVETELAPMLILMDQHGWEIMRLPLTAAREADRKKYNSPMVEEYQWYAAGSKVPGYHKYTVSGDPTYTNTSLDFTPTDGIDFYVTYTVKDEYTKLYSGAATEGATSASKFLVKQGNDYAKISGTSGTSLSTESTLPETIGDELQWYLKPNFNIDHEMGYIYKGETGAEEEALSQGETEEQNYNEGRNGFDPYNLQIQSVANNDRYFTANTSGSTVSNAWSGTTSEITLENLGTKQSGVIGLDQVKMNITNSTFMVVADANGQMVLMPRFDNTVVVNSLTGTQVVNVGTSTTSLTISLVPTVVTRSSQIKAMAGNYILGSGFTVDESVGTKAAPFEGIIDGQMLTISSLSTPFIAYAEDAIIKNIIVESATVSSGISSDDDDNGNTGAIVCVAKGNTRIYNVGINGGSVSGSKYVGGIVGLLDGYSRVINCYSYADITGGSYVGGIVGYNNYQTSSVVNATVNNLRTMVMNCMFYGDIDESCSNKAPIYNGLLISNKDANGLSNFNYFLAEQPYVQNNQIDTYNCALMAETRYLQRFEFFRLLLNSNLKLAGWWATGKYDKSEMMKWVLETADRDISDPKSYPVLKVQGKYPSIINIDAENAPSNGDRNGKKLGTLSVTISGVGSNAPDGASITNGSLTLQRTDKDFDRFNFNYDKVQLPYYNDVGTKNYTGNKVVTGWKITSITDGTSGSYTTGADATTDTDGNITSTPYNFADRNCTNKDLYSESGRVFNQGAYWDVPKDVTAITIEPYWGNAVYVADSRADVVYNQEMGTAYNVPTVGGGEIYKNGNTYNIAGDNQKVYTSMSNAAGQMPTTGTVYDNAIVLVGNVHSTDLSNKSGNKAYTIMSIDLDMDNEPDYSYILRFNSRLRVHPVRVDFVNIPGLGMAQKSTGGGGTYNFGIMQPLGWFESTNTSLFRVTQFEYDFAGRANSPMILQGGVIEQWVTVGGKEQNIKEGKSVSYYHVGGNVWFKEFHIGVHQDKIQDEFVSPHPPISVTGGDFDEFYLTGLYNTPNANYDDNAECYINGGRFGKVAGTGMQGIGSATNHTNGNIVWQIDNADIDEFYAGGINAAHIAEGNIYTAISNSRVDQFCGGPKFGNMNSDKKVVTNATNCTFRAFFGAGYGGNSYNRRYPENKNNVTNINWNNWVEDQYKNRYEANYKGVETRIDYQFLPMSGNTSNVARLFVDYVSFSLATTYDVTSKLTGCTITTQPLGRLSISDDFKCLGNFYGGGSLGKVNGPVKSTLTNCTVEGSAFGAGYSASKPNVEVDAIGFATEPYYYTATGTYRTGVKGQTTTYTWEHGNSISIDKDNHILYTTEDLTTLGTVTGKVTLNIAGTTHVEGSVYGGGESSSVTGAESSTTVNVRGDSQIDGSVFGGGDRGAVEGKATVNIEE